ncbi:hypothetical protein C2G38_2034804 [Gigaspora rosea]|uniref:Uncharacterized protein n=1 Tax=Gigaspora rosea TaxID=44941 RepID=A0A397VEN4_9GLOM|nr:hypothetical protein C2G38_2034804 [Gigaspora rosea]
MLVLKVAKFYTRLISQRWYLDTLDESVTTLENKPVISNKEFNKPGNTIHINFSHLENICGSHIFTKHISHEMVHRKQWEKGFGIFKKVLNLAIVTNRAEELYEIHKKLVKEMENEIKSQNSQAITENNELQEFAHTINNPISVKTKEESGSNAEKININKRKYDICGLEGYNARTCQS